MIKNRLKIQIVLVLLLLSILVWGAIIIKIRAEIKNQSIPTNKPGTNYPTLSVEASKSDDVLVLLDSLERISDPFSYYSHKKINQSQQIDLASKKIIDTIATPCFRFIGLLTDSDEKVAIIEISPDNIQFIREGQIIEGYKLEKISSKEIKFKNKEKQFCVSAIF